MRGLRRVLHPVGSVRTLTRTRAGLARGRTCRRCAGARRRTRARARRRARDRRRGSRGAPIPELRLLASASAARGSSGARGPPRRSAAARRRRGARERAPRTDAATAARASPTAPPLRARACTRRPRRELVARLDAGRRDGRALDAALGRRERLRRCGRGSSRVRPARRAPGRSRRRGAPRRRTPSSRRRRRPAARARGRGSTGARDRAGYWKTADVRRVSHSSRSGVGAHVRLARFEQALSRGEQHVAMLVARSGTTACAAGGSLADASGSRARDARRRTWGRARSRAASAARAFAGAPSCQRLIASLYAASACGTVESGRGALGVGGGSSDRSDASSSRRRRRAPSAPRKHERQRRAATRAAFRRCGARRLVAGVGAADDRDRRRHARRRGVRGRVVRRVRGVMRTRSPPVDCVANGSSASATSAIDGKRAAGSFASARRIVSSTTAGTSFARSRERSAAAR